MIKSSLESGLDIDLITDEREFRETKIDDTIAWLAANDPDSRHKTVEMVEADSELRFFLNRKDELERERDEKMHQRLIQFHQEIADLEKATPSVSQVGAAHQVAAKQQQWLEDEKSKRQAILDEDLKLIAARFNTLLSQCSTRLANAQAGYDAAYWRWQENNQPTDAKIG